MDKKNYNVLGIMSGTSLDGVDIAHINLYSTNGKWQYEIGTAQTIPYTNDWLILLAEAIGFTNASLNKLNDDYTVLLAGIIINFITIHGLTGLDALCSHGHTVLHQPQNGITLQIGNLPQIAKHTGILTVCDFRVQDVAMGGQGAPLVPMGDRLLFSDYDFCLNLGGFSNISFEKGDDRVAFDICPVNTVLNYFAGFMGEKYDDEGKLARSGKVLSTLLNELNNLEFYSKPYPKSLGFEYVKQTVLPLMEKFTATVHDKLRTFTEHIAVQVAKIANAEKAKKTMLVTGGGAYNTFLLERMQELMVNIQLIVPDAKTLEYKEALIFALLGVLKLQGENNVLSSVTGATHDHSAGVLYVP